MSSPAAAQPTPSDKADVQATTAKAGGSLNDKLGRGYAKRTESPGQRIVQVVGMLLVLGTAYGLWCLATLRNARTSLSYAYDTSGGQVRIQVAACDVRMVASSSAMLRYQVLYSKAEHQVNYLVTDPGKVSGGVFANSDGSCEEAPSSSCSVACQLTIEVPPAVYAAGTTFLFKQPSTDASQPVLRVESGVQLSRIRVVATTLHVYIEAGVTVDSFSHYVKSGNLRILGATIGSLNAFASGSGSVYVSELPSVGVEYDISYRQPSQRVCIATDDASATLERAPLVDGTGCNVAGVLAGTDNSAYRTYQYTQKEFDRDTNNRVTKQEFLQGIGELTCCGGSRPFYCNCEPLALEVFPPVDSDFYDRFSLPFSQFVENVVALNHSYLLGKGDTQGFACFDRLAVRPPNPAAQRSMQLQSNHGEILVTLRQAATGAPTTLFNETVYSPTSDRPGFRLRDVDAKRLMSTYGASVGDTGSHDSIYLTLEVEASVGLPAMRWIYVTHPIYLTLDPGLLQLLSLGTMNPPVRHEHVHVLNEDCHLDQPWGEATLNASLKDIHKQLSTALQSSYWSQGELRGVLVVQLDGDDGESRLYTYGTKDGEERQVWAPASSDVTTYNLALATVGLSLAFGTLVASLVTLAVLRSLKARRRTQQRRQFAQERRVLSQYLQTVTIAELNEAIADRTRLAVGYDSFDTLMHVIFDAVRSEILGDVFSSFNTFMSECLQETDQESAYTRAFKLGSSFSRTAVAKVRATASRIYPAAEGGGSAAASTEKAERFVYMRKLLREYEAFCLQHDLVIEPSKSAVQRALVRKYGARITQLTVDRLRGIKWRAQAGESAEISSAVTSVSTASAEAKASTATKLPRDWLQAFIGERCEITCDYSDFIDMKTRRSPDGTPVQGFGVEVYKWARAKGYAEEPGIGQDAKWTSRLPRGVLYKPNQNVRQLHGVELTQTAKLLSPQRAVTSACANSLVVLVVGVLFGLVVYAAATANQEWALSIASIDESGAPVRSLALLRSIVQPVPMAHVSPASLDHSFSLAVRPFIVLVLVALPTFALRLLAFYAIPVRAGLPRVLTALMALLTAVLFCCLFLVIVYGCVVLCWFVLASVTDPQVKLPYGAAAIAIVFVIWAVGQQVYDVLQLLRRAAIKTINRVLSVKLTKASNQLRRDVQEQLALSKRSGEGTSADSFDTELGGGAYAETPLEEITPEAIFKLLKEARELERQISLAKLGVSGNAEIAVDDEAEEDTISVHDFERLFNSLDLGLSSSQLQTLVAMLDLDAGGTVSFEEFKDGWDDFIQSIVEIALQNSGYSQTTVVLVAVAILLAIILLIAFIIVGLGAFSQHRTADSVLQTVLIGFVSKSSTDLNKKRSTIDDHHADELMTVVLASELAAADSD